MINNTLFLLTTVVAFFTNVSIFSQTNISYEKEINFKEITSLHYQVYQGHEAFPLNEEMSKIFEDRLARTKFCLKENLNHSSYKKISSLSLLNKINQNLKIDSSINNINDFNPLKYNFRYYENTDQLFLIDNTNYIIIIKAIKQ